ncbi:glycoside hydrolase family 13 protein [Candidatus Enterococcus ikei]|uniref:Glycoside hydrolase family 13 protein n=1 Tax=Candidatus Enterococcus ikei TaxID=2815326 RepID=A0ABS3GYZ9_9ENTE|nr:glycoside hydrolase family 13 protein [Enterococcus sp. DIV0869a]MBO0440189.1 glycoside hydrolase family 13 protein [Enterococcus sp. DIV0869a]
MTTIYYNSWLKQHKDLFGAIEQNGQMKFSIFIQSNEIEDVYFVIHKENSGQKSDYIKMESDAAGNYQCSYVFDQGKGLYFYYFVGHKKKDSFFYGATKELGGEGQLYESEYSVVPYQITCFSQADHAPKWYREAVFYQIFPDRFHNGNAHNLIDHPKKNSFIYGRHTDEPMYIKDETGNIVRWDFQGGNFKGIIEKIPYLKELGVTAIYLNPIFESVSNHRYDTANYLAIDGMLGDETEFRALVDLLHENDMHVILDGVFNHVGKNSMYFNYDGSYGEKTGAYRDPESPYYPWFTFTDYPKTYESWWGFDDLPEINKKNRLFQAFIYGESDSVLAKWNRFGIDGWRLDVADELPDFFIEGIRQNLNQYSDKILLGEVWEDASNKIAYDERRQYILGDSLHGVMNYPFRTTILALLRGEMTPEKATKNITTLEENYPTDIFYNNLNNLGTHDTERLLTMMDGNKTKALSAFSLLTVLPGIPCVYYGDEAGLTGGKDPENRKYFPWDNKDQTMEKGFRHWINVRKKTEVLKYGAFIPFYTEELLGILRYDSSNYALYVLNPNNCAKKINVADFSFTKSCPLTDEKIETILDELEIAAYDCCFISGKL